MLDEVDFMKIKTEMLSQDFGKDWMVVVNEMVIKPNWIVTSKVEQILVVLLYWSMKELLPMLGEIK